MTAIALCGKYKGKYKRGELTFSARGVILASKVRDRALFVSPLE
ncbi:hypothetical protein [Coleofasciculus sp. FACHB-129]|nr:hypothetical protein [Coleofasciculus sp. FACHB-129]